MFKTILGSKWLLASANNARSMSSIMRKEVMISQSRDLLSNTALEDWTAKNVNLQRKSMLVLSNNITKANKVEIKATLLDSEAYWKFQQFEDMVLSSLTPDLSLAKLPEMSTCQESLDPSSCSYSIHLELTKDVTARTVLSALEDIGWKFLEEDHFGEYFDCPTHLSLVRPDDGWFPGLEKIRLQLQKDMKEVTEEENSEQVNHEVFENEIILEKSDINLLQNSFGHV